MIYSYFPLQIELEGQRVRFFSCGRGSITQIEGQRVDRISSRNDKTTSSSPRIYIGEYIYIKCWREIYQVNYIWQHTMPVELRFYFAFANSLTMGRHPKMYIVRIATICFFSNMCNHSIAFYRYFWNKYYAIKKCTCCKSCILEHSWGQNLLGALCNYV